MRGVLVAVLLLALAACGGPSDEGGSSSGGRRSGDPSAGVSSYVALGDSYTAAPYVPLTDVADGCLRSNGNYPSLLAKRLGLSGSRFTDVSCSGATTVDVTSPQTVFGGGRIAPQIEAVQRDTALVTIGLGANDFGFFSTLVGSCAAPLVGAGKDVQQTCGDVESARASGNIPRIGTNVAGVVEAVRARAPRARIVVVGYPRVVEAGRTCPSQLPAGPKAVRGLAAVNRDLDTVLAKAARSTGAAYADMYAAGRGHDVCAGDEAWVNGVRTDTNRALGLHPFASEQRAVASEVLDLLRTDR